MKIVCDACSAKYSIADEKVAGKAFKIRCKKCGATIIVRGDRGTAETLLPSMSESSSENAEAIWHVVLNGDQQGPFSVAKLAQMVADGEISAESYVWKEGFDGWVAAKDVDELAGVVEHASGHSEQPARKDSEEPPTVVAPMGAAGLGGDLFAAVPGSEQSFDAGVAASSPSLAPAAQSPQPQSPTTQQDSSLDTPTLTGTRNENSVLFSLANLKSLATSDSTPKAPQSTTPAANGSAPMAASPNRGRTTAEEGSSGLIDIKALQSASASTEQSRSAEASDVVLPVASRTAPFAGTLAAPSLKPVEEKDRSTKILFIAVGVLGIGVVAAIALLVVFLMRDPQAQQTASPESSSGTPTATAGKPSDDTAAAGAPEQGTTSQGAEKTTTTERSGNSPTKSTSRTKSHAKSSSKGKSSPSASASSSSSSSSSKNASGGGSFDDLLNQAIGSKSGGGSSSSSSSSSTKSASSNLPDRPDRDEVKNILGTISRAVSSCGGGKHGKAPTAIKVQGPTGRVISVSVTGDFAGTPAATCISRAVRRAKFPKFSKASLTINYPFVL